MIFALDIETCGNPDMLPLLPEPECTDSRIKDPVKIAAHIAAKKESQVADMALDPLTGRVICFAAVGSDGSETTLEHVRIAESLSDDEERKLVQDMMTMLGTPETRVVTWNGVNFDLPYIYKRAMILGVDPANFGAPPLSAWTKRYAADKHFDLMQIWGGWSSQGYEKLDTVARMVLKEAKAAADVTTFAALMQTKEGRDSIAAYCLQDTRLTWRLFERFNGFLFA